MFSTRPPLLLLLLLLSPLRSQDCPATSDSSALIGTAYFHWESAANFADAVHTCSVLGLALAPVDTPLGLMRAAKLASEIWRHHQGFFFAPQ